MTTGNPNPNPAPNPQPAPQPAPAPQPQPNPAPQPAPSPQPNPQPQPQPGGQLFSEDYVRALREESASYRTKLRAHEQAARQALDLQEGAQLPDDVAGALAGLKTAGQQNLEATTTKAKAALLKGAFAAAAAGKVVDIDDAFALAGQELADAEVDLDTATIKIKEKDGKQRGVADLVEALLTRKPHLRAQAGTGAVGGTAPAGGGGGNEKDEDIAKRMAEARKGKGPEKSFWGR